MFGHLGHGIGAAIAETQVVIVAGAAVGVADDDGQITGAGLALDQDVVNAYDDLYDHDPQNFNPPRTIRTGLEFNF